PGDLGGDGHGEQVAPGHAGHLADEVRAAGLHVVGVLGPAAAGGQERAPEVDAGELPGGREACGDCGALEQHLGRGGAHGRDQGGGAVAEVFRDRAAGGRGVGGVGEGGAAAAVAVDVHEPGQQGVPGGGAGGGQQLGPGLVRGDDGGEDVAADGEDGVGQHGV